MLKVVVAGAGGIAPPRAALWAHPAGLAVSTPPKRAYEADGSAMAAWVWVAECHAPAMRARGGERPLAARRPRPLLAPAAVSSGDPQMLVRAQDTEALEVGDVYYWVNKRTRVLSAPQTKRRDVGPSSMACFNKVRPFFISFVCKIPSFCLFFCLLLF